MCVSNKISLGLFSSLTSCILQLYAFLVVCGYIAGALYTVLDTLVAPLLSDHLGFTISDISYFVLGTTVILVVSTAML